MRNSIFATIALAVASIGTASAVPIGNLNVDIFPSSAPNVFGSPSWAGYAADALFSIENGLGTTGDRSLSPTAYEVLGGTYAPGDIMVTSFNSWRGAAGASAPFDGELGNRLHFGLHIYGDGGVGSTKFKLEDLEFAIISSDAELDFGGDFIGFDFNGTTRYGIDWGADMVKGGGDDSIITGAGSGFILVDEMVYVGVGNAYWPGGPGDPLTGQAALDATAEYIMTDNVEIFNFYCITGSNGGEYCDEVRLFPSSPVQGVPEPQSAVLIVLGLLALGARRRWSKKIQNA